MPTEKADFVAILRTLARHEVDFVVVGGVCAVLHGAPMGTFDLDVVHSRREENVARLRAALEEMDAFYRTQPEKRLRPQLSHLSAAGHQLLSTRFGDLDVLGAIGRGLGYDELRPKSSQMEVGQGLRVLVLNLEELIKVKEQTAGEKDKAVLPLLRRTLEETRRKKKTHRRERGERRE